MLKALFLAGVDTFRLNFSHGSHEDHARVFHAIRTIEREMAMPIGILQDLQGPKIRLGRIAGGSASVSAGDVVRFVLRSESGETSAIPLPHPEIFAAVKPGDDLLIDDGRIRVRLLRVGADELEAEVIFGGAISDRKGVNIPGTVLDISPLTTKDRSDLAFGLDLGVDWVALSFVQKPGDLIEARGLIVERAGLVAKIEKPSALEKIDDIISLSDALMVARGDLGVEIPAEEVPGRQKELVRACRQAVKPVIVATQMLDSMVSSASPTRAEASDVAMAIYDGVDAVMLSAETATGRYPVETVEMMDRIIRSTEGHKLYNSILRATEPALEPTPAHAVAGAAADVATAIGAPAIVAFTSSGVTAARIARERPSLPIVAITADMAVARRLCLLWGAISLYDEDLGIDDRFEQAARLAKHVDLARSGDNLVIVSGIPFGQSGTTNNLRVARL
ncbi:hypothetical protein L907_21525 [Agrobacterium sp. C13]|nr:hypothetical protein L906_21550 [Agrobacterium sp. TS45]KVK66415.1 hypothetical protein L907_21525 [Agrobacterium sp. C13]